MPPLARGIRELHVLFEDSALLVRRNAGTGVADFDKDLAVMSCARTVTAPVVVYLTALASRFRSTRSIRTASEPAVAAST